VSLDPADAQSVLSSVVSTEDGHSLDFRVPYVDDGLAWADWVMAVAPATRMFDPVLAIGEDIRRPIPPACGFVRLRLAHYSLDLESGPDAEQYMQRHGLYAASPYHMLALVQHVPDIRKAIDHIRRRGPGLFATDPVQADGCADQAVGMWFGGADTPGRTQVMSYKEILGELTYFIFARDHWLTD
jgi:hypothetical protein